MTVATYAGYLALGAQDRRNPQIAVDTTFVALLVSGAAIQIWGALTAPPRHHDAVGSRSVQMAPGCGPAGSGIACGLALAGF